MSAVSPDEELASLKAEYARELPALVRALIALVTAASTDARAATSARRAAHQLHGTAGSYGYFAVGELAGRIEDALEDGEPVAPELLRTLDALSLGTPGAQDARSSGSSK
jgi:HPt (histidine-containing phosphotransfer) domain-containing protein